MSRKQAYFTILHIFDGVLQYSQLLFGHCPPPRVFKTQVPDVKRKNWI
jgi:hypothetical protein